MAVDEIIEVLKKLSLLEASDLVKEIESTFGVDVSNSNNSLMMPVAMGGGSGEAAAKPAEEKTEFDLLLKEYPADKKIAVLKVVRGIAGLGLKEAKEFVESVPKVLQEGLSKDKADESKKQLEEVGAVIELT